MPSSFGMSGGVMRFFLSVLAALAVSAVPCAAQTVLPGDDAGQIRKRFESPEQPLSRPSTGIILVEPSEPPGGAEDMHLVVRSFSVVGSTVYSGNHLAQALSDFTGRSVSVSDIYAAAQRITTLYGNDGYVLSRAVVPPQELDEHGADVRIEIVEGYVDHVQWPVHLASYRFFDHYADAITAERPVNVKTIERYLLLANDLPGLHLTSVLRPSESNPRAATLVVEATTKHIDASASVDNRGSKGRGPIQYVLQGAAHNLVRLHESIGVTYASVPNADELTYFAADAAFVLNGEGLKLAFSGYHSEGTPGINELQELRFAGNSRGIRATLSSPLIRTREENLTLSGTLFADDVSSDLLGLPNTRDQVRGLRLGLVYDRADQFAGINLVSLYLSQGIDGAGSSGNNNQLASRANGQADFTKLEGTASRLQGLGSFVSAFGHAEWQYAFDPLLSSEECVYGGSRIGRAFDPAHLTGDRCFAALLELRAEPGFFSNPYFQSQIYVFADYGYVDRIAPAAGGDKSDSASSLGAGVRFRLPANSEANFEAAKPLHGGDDRDWRGFFSVTARY